MKKLIVGMLFLGLVNLVYPQNSDSECESGEIKLLNVVVRPSNLSYLEKVKEGTLSDWVFALEEKASRHNINKSPYSAVPVVSNEVRFAQKTGIIYATYNDNGKILYTNELYRNIALPASVRTKVNQVHPGWSMNKNIYYVNYHHKQGARKTYKIQMQKDGSKRSIKLDSKGNPI